MYIYSANDDTPSVCIYIFDVTGIEAQAKKKKREREICRDQTNQG